MEKQAIAHVLDDLLKTKEILACMVVDRNMNHIMPTSEKLDVGANKVRDDFIQTYTNIFKMIDCYSEINLNQMKWTFNDCDVWFFVFPDFQNALMAIVPHRTNEGFVQVKLEQARQNILQILKDEATASK